MCLARKDQDTLIEQSRSIGQLCFMSPCIWTEIIFWNWNLIYDFYYRASEIHRPHTLTDRQTALVKKTTKTIHVFFFQPNDKRKPTVWLTRLYHFCRHSALWFDHWYNCTVISLAMKQAHTHLAKYYTSQYKLLHVQPVHTQLRWVESWKVLAHHLPLSSWVISSNSFHQCYTVFSVTQCVLEEAIH